MLLTSVVRPLTTDPVASSVEPSAANTSPLRDVTSDCTEAKMPEAGVSPSASVYMLLTSVVKPVRADPVAKSDEPSAAKTSPLRSVIEA